MYKTHQILFNMVETRLYQCTTKRRSAAKLMFIRSYLHLTIDIFWVRGLSSTVHRPRTTYIYIYLIYISVPRTNPTNRFHRRFGAHWHCPVQCTVSATGMMYGTVSVFAYGHLVCYSVSAPNPCNVNERPPLSLPTQNWNCISRCRRYLMVCISESITDALRH